MYLIWSLQGKQYTDRATGLLMNLTEQSMRRIDTAVFVCTNILTEKNKQEHHSGKGDGANQSTSKHIDITVKTHFENTLILDTF